LVYENIKPFNFGTLRVSKNALAFTHGLYERYSGFNKFELSFAKALDGVGQVWHRDFIVWKKSSIFCLDTKGGHLLSDAVARKLFDIKEDGKTKVQVRFITQGKQTELRGKALKGGYTVWKMKTGSPTPVHVDGLDKAVKECLR
jgi:type III restriction enzyme